jgi:hypothetical protein
MANGKESGPMKPPVKTKALTWRDLTKIEPRLVALYQEIRTIKDNGESFCANALWYGYASLGFKDRMSRLVGFTADDPRLRTMEAYGVAYKKLYEALPNCRNCGCG